MLVWFPEKIEVVHLNKKVAGGCMLVCATSRRKWKFSMLAHASSSPSHLKNALQFKCCLILHNVSNFLYKIS